MGPNIYQSRSHFWSWPRDLSNIFYFKWWTTRATTTTITYYSVKTPHTHSLRRFSPLVDAISPHELEVWMLFVYSLDAYIAPVSHTCVPAWRNALIYTNIMYLMCPTKNNIQCLASRVCLDISSLPFCAAHICTLHLAELLSMCVLTQSLDCSICHPLCIWCASLAFHVLLFHILIYIDIYIYV